MTLRRRWLPLVGLLVVGTIYFVIAGSNWILDATTVSRLSDSELSALIQNRIRSTDSLTFRYYRFDNEHRTYTLNDPSGLAKLAGAFRIESRTAGEWFSSSAIAFDVGDKGVDTIVFIDRDAANIGFQFRTSLIDLSDRIHVQVSPSFYQELETQLEADLD